MSGAKISSVEFKTKNKALRSGREGASQDVRVGPEKLQGSMRSQKTQPERDKAILIDAFHVKEAQEHHG